VLGPPPEPLLAEVEPDAPVAPVAEVDPEGPAMDAAVDPPPPVVSDAESLQPMTRSGAARARRKTCRRMSASLTALGEAIVDATLALGSAVARPAGSPLRTTTGAAGVASVEGSAVAVAPCAAGACAPLRATMTTTAVTSADDERRVLRVLARGSLIGRAQRSKIFPGFMIPFGSRARFTARIISISAPERM
jgi:hypothetical protein